jgi:peptidyl-prolyl cis-trans isomerase B (cyclophilin B)
MSETFPQVNPRSAINPLRIAAAILYFLVAVFSLVNGELLNVTYNFGFLVSNELAVQAVIYHHAFSLIAIPFGAIALGIITLLSKKKALLLILSIAYFVLIAPLSWILQFMIASTNDYWVVKWTMPFMDTIAEWDDGPIGWGKLAGFTLASLLAIFASLTSDKSASFGIAGEEALGTPTSVSNNQVYSTGSTPSNLPLFALVGSFFFPIVGVVLGHISLSQMKRGQIVSDNRGLAVGGIVLGYVFIGLSIIVGIVLVVALIINASPNSY